MFKSEKSLFSNSIGINILIKSITKLDKVLNMIKDDKRYLKNKKYLNYILLSENSIITSIVLSNVIPHIMKYESTQNTASLFQNIGIKLNKTLIYNFWIKYKEKYKEKSDEKSKEKGIKILSDIDVKISIIIDKIEEGLNEDNFNKRLDEILGIIESDDYFKLGGDLAEIIAQNSNIFELINKLNRDKTVQRTIVQGNDLNDNIVKLLAVDTEKLVMISKPAK